MVPEAATDLVGGRYRLDRDLGTGARKVVYLAYDTLLERPIAIAVIRADGLDEVEQERLRREMQMLARFSSHPNIVTLYDVTELDGATSMLFEYVPGGSLADLLELAGVALPVRDALRIAAHIARALDEIHRAGIIFRDVKPGNVLLTGEGTAKLCDFGLAYRHSDTRITDPTFVMGSLTYVAPERIAHKHYDERSDLYSLGIVLYEMLAGQPPFPGHDPDEVGAQHLHAEPVTLLDRRDDLPAGVQELVASLLAKDVGARPTSAAEVVAQLEALAAQL